MKKHIINCVPPMKKYIRAVAALGASGSEFQHSHPLCPCAKLTSIFSEIRIREAVYSWFIHRVLQILLPERKCGSLTTLSLPFRDICMPWQFFVLWTMGGVCYWKTEDRFALCVYIPLFQKIACLLYSSLLVVWTELKGL